MATNTPKGGLSALMSGPPGGGAGSNPSHSQGALAVAPTSGPPRPPRARRPKHGSTIPIVGGEREVKAYPVTEDELSSLGLLQATTTAVFSLSSGLGGFWISIKQNLAFADKVDPSIRSYWEAMGFAAGCVAIFLFVVGGALIYLNFTKVGKIKKGTKHVS
jgi:hypothetical protein